MLEFNETNKIGSIQEFKEVLQLVEYNQTLQSDRVLSDKDLTNIYNTITNFKSDYPLDMVENNINNLTQEYRDSHPNAEKGYFYQADSGLVHAYDCGIDDYTLLTRAELANIVENSLIDYNDERDGVIENLF